MKDYQSPIYTYISNMQLKMTNDYEDGVVKAVQNVGINVDKEELERALRYDREQYEKGYADGLRDGKQDDKIQALLYSVLRVLEAYGLELPQKVRDNY